jgi:hypothetical protein
VIPILDIASSFRSEGFATEWVLACSRCGGPFDHGGHADCEVVLADTMGDAPGQKDQRPVTTG